MGLLEKYRRRRRLKKIERDSVGIKLKDLPGEDQPTSRMWPPPKEPFEVLSVREMMDAHAKTIQDIVQMVGLSSEETNAVLMPVIVNVARWVHLLPASEYSHHQGCGGLFAHSLEVAKFCVNIALSTSFSFAVSPEEKEQNRRRWRLAAAIVGLLHDTGKADSDMSVMIADMDGFGKKAEGNRWQGNIPLLDWLIRKQALSYVVSWNVQREHNKHNESSLANLKYLVPDVTFAFLASGGFGSVLVAEMKDALLNGASGQTLGKILSRADGYSVKFDQDKQRHYPQAYKNVSHPQGIPMLEAMRELVKSGKWTVSQDESSKVFVTMRGCFIEWAEGAKDVFRQAQLMGCRSLPNDVMALAQILIQCDAAVPYANQDRDGIKEPLWNITPISLKDMKIQAIRMSDFSFVSASAAPAPEEVIIWGDDQYDRELFEKWKTKWGIELKTPSKVWTQQDVDREKSNREVEVFRVADGEIDIVEVARDGEEILNFTELLGETTGMTSLGTSESVVDPKSTEAIRASKAQCAERGSIQSVRRETDLLVSGGSNPAAPSLVDDETGCPGYQNAEVEQPADNEWSSCGRQCVKPDWSAAMPGKGVKDVAEDERAEGGCALAFKNGRTLKETVAGGKASSRTEESGNGRLQTETVGLSQPISQCTISPQGEVSSNVPDNDPAGDRGNGTGMTEVFDVNALVPHGNETMAVEVWSPAGESRTACADLGKGSNAQDAIRERKTAPASLPAPNHESKDSDWDESVPYSEESVSENCPHPYGDSGHAEAPVFSLSRILPGSASEEKQQKASSRGASTVSAVQVKAEKIEPLQDAPFVLVKDCTMAETSFEVQSESTDSEEISAGQVKGEGDKVPEEAPSTASRTVELWQEQKRSAIERKKKGRATVEREKREKLCRQAIERMIRQMRVGAGDWIVSGIVTEDGMQWTNAQVFEAKMADIGISGLYLTDLCRAYRSEEGPGLRYDGKRHRVWLALE